MYLTKDEIEGECRKNPTLLNQFNKFKNSDGYLPINEFDRITNKMVELEILKKLVRISTSSKVSILFTEFKYIYAMFRTESREAKANFVLDFIFYDTKSMSKEDYLAKCNKYFSKSSILMSMLTDEALINTGNGNGKSFSKSKVYNHIFNNHIESLHKFTFLKSKNDMINTEVMLILNNINSTNSMIKGSECSCFKKCNLDMFSQNNSIQFKENDKLNKEFKMIEKNNNGIFPIKVLVRMLTDINVKSSLIDLIDNYLKKRTQKSFINFEQFTDLFHKLTCKEIEESLFELLAYPKKEIKKNDLFLFIKASKLDIGSKEINDYFSQLDIKDTITKQKFSEMLSLINQELLVSFEHIKYLPYIYFKQKCTDKSIEKNCIEVLMKRKCLSDTLKEKAQIEDCFWIIDSVFWKKWNDYLENNNIKNPKKTEKALRINTSKISDKNGRLKEGLVYLKDYFVISNKMYELFTSWYGHPNSGEGLKRSKVYLSENNSDRRRNSSIRDDSPFVGLDQSLRRYEIEIYPVFLLFFNFDELLKKNNSFHQIKDSLKTSLFNTQDENIKFYPFSRTTKFIDLLKPLAESTGLDLELNKTRLWVYYQGKFYQVIMTKSLEDEGITNSAIIVLETLINQNWPSEIIKKENGLTSRTQKSCNVVGLVNIGNTCYMNSVLQIFLEIVELKEMLFDNKNIEYILNKNKHKRLVKEMINLFREKYQNEKKSITPKKFKEICGDYNKTFRDYEQQDAYDFFNFLVDSLHGDINIKEMEIKIESKEKITELIDIQEQGNISWANNIRNNLSYLHSLFLGQLKSELICTKCKSSKVSFETFSSLSLPIPEETVFTLEIILFRLPFTAKVYYEDINSFVKEKKGQGESIRRFLKNIRKKSLGIPSNDEANIHSNLPRKTYVPLTTAYFEQEVKIKTDNEIIFTNAINMNIPLRIKIEVNRKDNCSEIIKKIRQIPDLELEKFNTLKPHSFFLITNDNNYANPDCKIDDCFNPGQVARVYEILTSQGIHKLFNYSDTINKDNAVIPLQNDKIPSMLNKNEIINYNDLKDPNPVPLSPNREILIGINHRVILPKSALSIDFFNHPNTYEQIEANKDYILLPIFNSINGKDLYNFIWEKYEYFLNNPTKYEGTFWWKKKRQMNSVPDSNCNSRQGVIQYNIPTNGVAGITPTSNRLGKKEIKNCSPFVLKLVNKKTLACISCPWFKFCTGCIIDRQDSSFITVDYNTVLIVEWCREIYIKEIQGNNNFQLIINHSSLDNKPVTSSRRQSLKETQTQATLDDCLKLLTKSEDVSDVFCEVCSCKSSFKKKFEIERLPKYLVLTLKRFKYTSLYKKKITNLVTFPTNHLKLTQFLCSNNINDKLETEINLFGVINHTGTLTEGHYSTIINVEDKWTKYDDSKVTEFEDNLQCSSVYMLIYKVNINKTGKLYFDYNGLLNTAYQIYLKTFKYDHLFNFDYKGTTLDHQKVIENKGVSKYYYGEPVKTDKGSGYLVNIYQEGGVNYAKIKKDVGFVVVPLQEDIWIKESIVIENSKYEETPKIHEENNIKLKNQRVDCGCFIF